MTKLEKLKTMINDQFDKVEDKESIEALGAINTCLDELEAESLASAKDYRDLLSDYKELVKHTSFAIKGNDNPDNRTGVVEALSLEEFVKVYKTNDNGSNN